MADRLFDFLKTVESSHLKIFFKEQMTSNMLSWITFAPGKSFHLAPDILGDTPLACVLRSFALSSDLTEKEKEMVFSHPGPVVVPLEPLSYDPVGIGLWNMGIGKPARPEILLLFWKAYSLLRQKNDYSCSSFPSFSRDFQRLLPSLSEEVVRAILKALPSLPSTYLDLQLPAEPISRTTFSQQNRTYEKAYEPRISVLALEQCNRACSHCGLSSTPRLPKLRYDNFLSWAERLQFAPLVTITYGEPFFWSDSRQGRLATLGDLLEVIACSAKHVTIVTSGINMAFGTERQAADKIAELPAAQRERIRIELTLSDYPAMRNGVLVGYEAARKAQIDTIVFAARNRLMLGFISFLSNPDAREQILLPALHSLYPSLDGINIAASRNVIKQRCAVPLGRAAQNAGQYLSPAQHIPHAGCLQSFGLRTYEKLEPLREDMVFLKNAEGAYLQHGELALAGDGALLPGCCSNLSPFAEVAHMEKHTDREIQEKTNSFVRRLDSLRAVGKLDCIACLAGAKIRHDKRFRAVVGPEVVALRSRLQQR